MAAITSWLTVRGHHRIFEVHQLNAADGDTQFNVHPRKGTHFDESPCRWDTGMTVYVWVGIRTQARQLRGTCTWSQSFADLARSCQHGHVLHTSEWMSPSSSPTEQERRTPKCCTTTCPLEWASSPQCEFVSHVFNKHLIDLLYVKYNLWIWARSWV